VPTYARGFSLRRVAHVIPHPRGRADEQNGMGSRVCKKQTGAAELGGRKIRWPIRPEHCNNVSRVKCPALHCRMVF
jgi:hypothetical protein